MISNRCTKSFGKIEEDTLLPLTCQNRKHSKSFTFEKKCKAEKICC